MQAKVIATLLVNPCSLSSACGGALYLLRALVSGRSCTSCFYGISLHCVVHTVMKIGELGDGHRKHDDALHQRAGND